MNNTNKVNEDNKIKLHKLIDRHDKKGGRIKIDNFFEIIKDIGIKKGLKILEIGAGNGIFSNFLAVYFNVVVISSDPYKGNGSLISNYSINKSIVKELDYDRVQVLRKDFLDFKTNEKFKYIFAINVVHHIIETRKVLSDDCENYKKCVNVFRKAYNLLDSDGILIIRDVEKENFLKKNNIKTSVNYELKQNNWEWEKALKEAGFKEIKVRHLTPRIIRKIPLAHFIFNNRFVSLFFDSAYVIIANK